MEEKLEKPKEVSNKDETFVFSQNGKPKSKKPKKGENVKQNQWVKKSQGSGKENKPESSVDMEKDQLVLRLQSKLGHTMMQPKPNLKEATQTHIQSKKDSSNEALSGEVMMAETQPETNINLGLNAKPPDIGPLKIDPGLTQDYNKNLERPMGNMDQSRLNKHHGQDQTTDMITSEASTEENRMVISNQEVEMTESTNTTTTGSS